MKAILIGYGRMGHMLEDVLVSRGHVVAGKQDAFLGLSIPDNATFDAVLDFSHRSALPETLRLARANKAVCVIGTTALTDEDRALIAEAARDIPVIAASNYSLGVAVMKKAAALLAAALPDWDIEITETHHRKKLDAPSGTALSLLHAVDPDGTRETLCGREGTSSPRGREIGMHSLRGGTVAGVHTLDLFGESEQLTLTHRAESRQVFAAGAVAAAEKLQGRPAGLYNFDDLI